MRSIRTPPRARGNGPTTPENSSLGTERQPQPGSVSSTLPAWARTALREPLLHFFFLGLGLWAAQRALLPPPRIELSRDAVTQLERDFTRRSGQAPSAAARTALLRDYFDSEILYREALQRGLLTGDVIVRRRLIQKMEFLAEALPELTPQAGPTDAQLQALLDKEQERYRIPARQTLRHVFIARHADDSAATLAARAQALRQRILQGESAANLGDPFPRGNELPALSASELDGLFGPGFASAIQGLPLDQWSAALPSSYGLHLVLVNTRQPEQTPRLDSVRARLRADWEEAQRGPRKEAALQRLWQQYDVRVAGQPVVRTAASPGSAGIP